MAPELTSEAWAQIRYDYEHTDRPIADICAEHGISDGTLRDRVRRWNWTRRRAPIPHEGPPSVVRIEQPPQTVATIETAIPTPDPSPQAGGEQAEPAARVVPGWGGEQPALAAPIASSRDANAPAESDPAAIAPRLQSAVARVLPAIEATIAKLAAGPKRPREMEQTARALGTLTRTLRELNALLSQHAPHAANEYDDMPEDIDAFRERLARRIEAFMELRSDETFEDEPADAAPAAR